MAGRSPGIAATALRRLLRRLRNELDLEALKRQGLQLGAGAQIADGAWIDPGWPWLISIGENVVMAPRAMVFAHDAGMRLHLDVTRIAPVTIGPRVYVGAGAIILPGVTIGEGAVVGAGSIVTHDVAPMTVVVGNPARQIATAEELKERHRAALERSVLYPADMWSLGTITEAHREQQRRDAEGGGAYVEARVRVTGRPSAAAREDPAAVEEPGP